MQLASKPVHGITKAIQGLDFILSESMSDLIDCNDVMLVLGATQLSQK